MAKTKKKELAIRCDGCRGLFRASLITPWDIMDAILHFCPACFVEARKVCPMCKTPWLDQAGVCTGMKLE